RVKLRTVTVGKSRRLPSNCLRDFANTVPDADHRSAAARIQISLSVCIIQIHPFGALGDGIVVSEAAGKDEVSCQSAHISARVSKKRIFHGQESSRPTRSWWWPASQSSLGGAKKSRSKESS